MVAIICLCFLCAFLGAACWINGIHADKLNEYAKALNEENDGLKGKIEALTEELNKAKKEKNEAVFLRREERRKLIEEHTQQLNEMRVTLEKAKQDEEELRLIAKYFMKYTKTDDELLF